MYAYVARVRKAGEQVVELRLAAANGALSIRKSVQDERRRRRGWSRILRLRVALALETQTALAVGMKRWRRLGRRRSAASPALLDSLQQERARAERLEPDFALTKRVASKCRDGWPDGAGEVCRGRR
jgi:hypothetical protein